MCPYQTPVTIPSEKNQTSMHQCSVPTPFLLAWTHISPISHKDHVWTHNKVYRVWTYCEVFLYGHTPKSHVWGGSHVWTHTHTNVMYGLTIMFSCMDTHKCHVWTNYRVFKYGHTISFIMYGHIHYVWSSHVWTHTHTTVMYVGFSCMDTQRGLSCMDTT